MLLFIETILFLVFLSQKKKGEKKVTIFLLKKAQEKKRSHFISAPDSPKQSISAVNRQQRWSHFPACSLSETKVKGIHFDVIEITGWGMGKRVVRRKLGGGGDGSASFVHETMVAVSIRKKVYSVVQTINSQSYNETTSAPKKKKKKNCSI